MVSASTKIQPLFDRIWKLLCHQRIFFLPLLAQFLIVLHDIWCIRKRLYTCRFCGINSKRFGGRILVLAETVATVKATEAERIQSFPNAPKIMRNYQELSE